jgi:hypothetical protein
MTEHEIRCLADLALHAANTPLSHERGWHEGLMKVHAQAKEWADELADIASAEKLGRQKARDDARRASYLKRLDMLEQSLGTETYAKIGERYGVSSGRCAHLVRWAVSSLMAPSKGKVPEHSWWLRSERAAHKEFWEQRIAQARTQE